MNIGEMPKACKKSQLHKVFREEPTNTLRSLINRIIAEKRGKKVEEIKHLQSVRKNEVLAIMIELGYAEEKQTLQSA